MAKREIRFNTYISVKYDDKHKRIEGTGCYTKDYPNKGLFHQWGLEAEEGEGSFGNNTVAIIELENGEIVTTLPYLTKFTAKE